MRDLAIALMDDEQGICLTGWKMLRDLLLEQGETDLVESVKETEGRFYLPEGFGS